MSNEKIVEEVAKKIARSYAFDERSTEGGRATAEIVAEEIVAFVRKALRQ